MAAKPPVAKKSADPYEDLSLFEAFKNHVDEEVADQREGDQEFDPVWFPDVNNHTYRMRFAPEIMMNQETGKQELVLTRTVFSHSGFDKLRRIKCQGPGCPICAETKRLKDAKFDKAWRYGSKREAIARVWIFDATTKKDYKYLKTGEYGFMVMRNKTFNSFNNFLANLDPSEMRQVLNPKIAAPEILLTLTPGSDGSASWSFGLKNRVLEAFPEDYKSIYEVYVMDDDVPTDDELKEIRRQVNKMLASIDGQLVEPDDDGDKKAKGAAKPEARANAKAAVAGALGKKKEEPAEEAEEASESEPEAEDEDRECPGADEGLEFGNNPQVRGGDISAACLSCAHEDECKEVTERGGVEADPPAKPEKKTVEKPAAKPMKFLPPKKK